MFSSLPHVRVCTNGRFSVPTFHCQLMWVQTDVCGLLSVNVGCCQFNVGLDPLILSINLGRKTGCLWV